MVHLCRDGARVTPWVRLQHAREDAPCPAHQGPEVNRVQQVADGQTLSRWFASDTSEERVPMVCSIFTSTVLVEVGAPENDLDWQSLPREVRDVSQLRRRLQHIACAQTQVWKISVKPAPLVACITQATMDEKTPYAIR